MPSSRWRVLLGLLARARRNGRLTVLAYALQDLDVGRVAPVVRPTKRKGGSPPDSSVTWIMRVRVLIALDALARSGMTQEKATSYINSKYPKLRGLMSRGKDLPVRSSAGGANWRRQSKVRSSRFSRSR